MASPLEGRCEFGLRRPSDVAYPLSSCKRGKTDEVENADNDDVNERLSGTYTHKPFAYS